MSNLVDEVTELGDVVGDKYVAIHRSMFTIAVYGLFNSYVEAEDWTKEIGESKRYKSFTICRVRDCNTVGRV